MPIREYKQGTAFPGTLGRTIAESEPAKTDAPTGKPDVKNGKGAPGKVELYFDRKLVGEGKLPVTIPLAFWLGGGLVVGRATGFPISPRFKSECAFTGTIYDVVIDVSGDLIVDKESEMRAVMARQ